MLGSLARGQTTDLIIHKERLPVGYTTGPLPKEAYELRNVDLPLRPVYQPDAPTLKSKLSDSIFVHLIDFAPEVVRKTLARMLEGNSHVLMVLTEDFRVVHCGDWWARLIDTTIQSETINTALRSVRNQGMLVERNLWKVCLRCGTLFPVHRYIGAAKTCNNCRENVDSRHRQIRTPKDIDDLLSSRYPGVDYSQFPKPFFLPQPSQLFMGTEEGYLVAVVFGEPEGGSQEAGEFLKAFVGGWNAATHPSYSK